jgi:hypothetical protein
MIVDATPVSMIPPSETKKKKKSKRSKKESTPDVEEESITPSPSVDKSNKKKSKKSKIGSSKKAHSMTSLYVDPLPSETVDAAAGASIVHDQSHPEIDKADSEFKRHPMAQNIIDFVLGEIKKPDVVIVFTPIFSKQPLV